MTRPWEEGDARGTIETIPFPGHRSMAEVWRTYFAAHHRLAEHRKPTKEDVGDAR